MRIKFIGGEFHGTTRSVEVVPGCLPEHLHVSAPTADDPHAMAAYEPMDGRFEIAGDGDQGAYLYAYTGPVPKPSGI
jgi:hypothetical protein